MVFKRSRERADGPPAPEPIPLWWRGRSPETDPVLGYGPGMVLTGAVGPGAVDLSASPLRGGLRGLRIEQATVTALTLALDEAHFVCLWSRFSDSTFTQRSRALTPGGPAPQGSFGIRPCLYERCRFVGVRFSGLGGFSAGEARFEDCVFERCRWSGHFSLKADYVRCRFTGTIKNGSFDRLPSKDGRPNEIVGNDFTDARIENVGWRHGIDLAAQRWPADYAPTVDM